MKYISTTTSANTGIQVILFFFRSTLTLILPRSRMGTVWFYTSTSNKRAARPKLYTQSLTRDLKLMYSRFTLVRISIKFNSSQLNMFREIILPIFRSTRLCVTACGVMHPPRCCRPKAGNIELTGIKVNGNSHQCEATIIHTL